MFGNTDKPIENSLDDQLGTEIYVNGLCSYILNCDTPMTISIQGDWGSGKTSMMNMIKDKIKKDVHPIWFNTWQFSQFDMGDALVFSMMEVMLIKLGCEPTAINKAINGIKSFVINAAKVVVDRTVGGDLVNITDDKPVNQSIEILELKKKFQGLIDEAIQKTRMKRIVIFVDDLDRLQPSKAVELLEVLKVFLDCNNCVYVLAVDYEVVTQGIKQKFGDAVGEHKGKSFFDKIIQLPFKMPVAQYDISKYVFQQFSKMNMKLEDKDVSDYVDLIRLSIGCNPRSMKRLFNTYQLLDIIMKSIHTCNDISFGRKLLFATICMQMEFEDLYEYIVINRGTLDSSMLLDLTDDIFANDDLKDNFRVIDESELARIAAFMKKFISVLQLDDNAEISEIEIENLKEILSFSSVTSVNSTNDIQVTNDLDWVYRYKNKDIVKAVNDAVRESTGLEFTVWQPRKNKSFRKISDTWGWIQLKSENGVAFAFDYSLNTNYATKNTVVRLSVYYRKPSTESDFYELFATSPISYPCTKIDGGYSYENVYTFTSDNADDACSQILTIVCKAVKELEEYMK